MKRRQRNDTPGIFWKLYGRAYWVAHDMIYPKKRGIFALSDKKIDAKKMSNLPTYRYLTGMALLNDKIYVSGGAETQTMYFPTNLVEAYDIKTDSWEEVCPMLKPVHHHNMATLDGYIYKVGGFPFRVEPTNYAERYDPNKDIWEEISPSIHKHATNHIIGHNGKLYVSGGRYKAAEILEQYDPKQDSWEVLSKMLLPRGHHKSVVYGDEIFFIGGDIAHMVHNYDHVTAYNTNTNEWSLKAKMPIQLSELGACEYKGYIWVFGGERGWTVSRNILRYDPRKDNWEVYGIMKVPRYACQAIPTEKGVFLLGGNVKCGWHNFSNLNELYLL